MPRLRLAAIALASVMLAGCDMIGGALGLESPEKLAASREADGRAIGGACRHAGRAIEDCYTLNKKAEKAAVFAGWRDMNDYMRENKIEPVAPQLSTQLARVSTKTQSDADAVGSAAEPDKAAPRAVEAASPSRPRRGERANDS